ncbi:alpha/beta hydrolase-fold protein [Pseudomonas sp. RIT-PI-AD]|uniref:alpha/beta hydrolase n=1 Tax=Pseudomonas sp. RIT-PI-AD TaxID=3035294 RepID=UPI0021D7F1EF|nr:alpha/beta hydrolase-fold protein [Pseudomonas sp. RIT-PI-AD]
MPRALGILLSLALLAQGAPAVARPVADQPMDAPVLREASAYRFGTLEMDSADGARHYRVWIGQPASLDAATPVAYLLDGNAAMSALDTDLLNRLAQRPAPPVLVAVGYATPLRIERSARTFDYTPRIGGAAEQRDPLTAAPSGGADAFLDFLTQRLRPLIDQRLKRESSRQLLWGHSYGGLLVLHALMTRPETFQVYAAASPSLWWGNGAIAADRPGMELRLRGSRPQLLLMRGDLEPASPTAAAEPGVVRDAAAKRLLESLRQLDGLEARYETFPGLGHGPMLAASLRHTLEWLSQGVPAQ